MDKSLGHFCVSGSFSNSHRSNPSPHPTNNVGGVYPEFFQSFNSKRCTVLRGNQEMAEKYEYCSIVPPTWIVVIVSVKVSITFCHILQICYYQYTCKTCIIMKSQPILNLILLCTNGHGLQEGGMCDVYLWEGITDLINVKVWIRRDDSASRVVNPLSRQISSKSTLLSFQSLYKSSGSFLRLIMQIE